MFRPGRPRFGEQEQLGDTGQGDEVQKGDSQKEGQEEGSSYSSNSEDQALDRELLQRLRGDAASKTETGRVKIPEDRWMRIPLVDDWERVMPKPRAYPLGAADRKLVDDTFDALHKEGKMSWATNHTPTGYPVFVVYRTVNGVRKGRVVVDTRGLNKVSQQSEEYRTVSYPLETTEGWSEGRATFDKTEQRIEEELRRLDGEECRLVSCPLGTLEEWFERQETHEEAA
ncbi:hypothetical protein N7452_005029 [Penicillium brevicompactum]|uniref:Uncharacterized protein n=1 Tax=Penicillium brevicompactum TaxID=5074 RepID=A0A9W9UH15_PENBR|nr:hypothetical protein N7452_005029 [Penicillium brevicompactum]